MTICKETRSDIVQAMINSHFALLTFATVSPDKAEHCAALMERASDAAISDDPEFIFNVAGSIYEFSREHFAGAYRGHQIPTDQYGTGICNDMTVIKSALKHGRESCGSRLPIREKYNRYLDNDHLAGGELVAYKAQIVMTALDEALDAEEVMTLTVAPDTFIHDIALRLGIRHSEAHLQSAISVFCSSKHHCDMKNYTLMVCERNRLPLSEKDRADLELLINAEPQLKQQAGMRQ